MEEDRTEKDRIIKEVKLRPPLWNRCLPENKDKSLRARLWKEVGENVVSNWHKLSHAQRKYEVKNIQTKWKNMKDYFQKELNALQGKYGETAHKKRKYIYFDDLAFLIPTLQRDSCCGIKLRQKRNEQVQKEDIEQEENISREQQRPDPLQETNKCDEYDEDINFSKMLVPLLRKLNDDQKHFAKIEILNILKTAKTYGQPDTACHTDISVKAEVYEIEYPQASTPQTSCGSSP